MRIQKKILSVLIISFLLLSRSLVFAQEVQNITPTETPTPTISETSITPTPTDVITPTPTEDPSYNEYDKSTEYSDSNSEAVGPDAANLDPTDTTDIIASHSSQIDITIENNNDATVDKNASTTNNTGGNQAVANIDLYNNVLIQTGDAHAQENHSNILNTNIIGEYILSTIVNFLTGDASNNYDFSQFKACAQELSPVLSSDIQLSEADGNKINVTDIYQRTDTLGIINNNVATVTNNITVDALTGDNKSLDNIASTTIRTGDSTIDVNLFNLINTNLVGECGFFGVFNFFSPQTSSLILPNDDDFISHTSSPTTISAVDILNSNTVDTDTQTNANANTGENKLNDSINWLVPPTISTGDISTSQDILDLTNLNYTMNNFAVIRIQHFGHWTGKLIGWDGLVFEGDDYLWLVKDNSLADNFAGLTSGDESLESTVNQDGDTENIDIDTHKYVVIDNNNTATLRNYLNLNADTGHNEANKLNAEIQTGNAQITTDIFNMLNTNIVGKNWYFGVINIFDTFTGDIIFPRADAAVSMTADTPQVTSNSTFTYRIHYVNGGQLPANDTTLVAVFPSDTKIVSTSKQGIKSGQTMTWSLGNLNKNQSGDVYVQVQVNSSNDPHALLATSVIHTSSKEVETNNNSSQVSVLFKIESSNQPAANQSNSSSSSNQTTVTTTNVQTNPTPTPVQSTIKKFLDNTSLSQVNGTSSNNIVNAHKSKPTVQSQGKIDIGGLFEKANSWLPLIIAYFLGVGSTLLAIRIKRLLS